jgi:hypothetical protein
VLAPVGSLSKQRASCSRRSDVDLVAELADSPSQSSRDPIGVSTREMGRTQILVVDPVAQHVVDRGEDRSRDGDGV